MSHIRIIRKRNKTAIQVTPKSNNRDSRGSQSQGSNIRISKRLN